jgi:hypothetical protein
MSDAPNAGEPATPEALTELERLTLAIDLARAKDQEAQEQLRQQGGVKSATGMAATLALLAVTGAGQFASDGSTGMEVGRVLLLLPAALLGVGMWNFVAVQRSKRFRPGEQRWSPMHPVLPGDAEQMRAYYDTMTLSELLDDLIAHNLELADLYVAKNRHNERGWSYLLAAFDSLLWIGAVVVLVDTFR